MKRKNNGWKKWFYIRLLIVILALILSYILMYKANKLGCTSYGASECPRGCVVCPPCIECSSISCHTEDFCSNIGFNQTWYESTK